MNEAEEKTIFDRATEKLDLYVPLLLKYDQIDDAKEFLQPGGPYVRFAVKEFMKELLDERRKRGKQRKGAHAHPEGAHARSFA